MCSNSTNGAPHDPNRGGPNRIFPGVKASSSIAYFGTTTAIGGDVQKQYAPSIHGELLVVDTTNPAAPAIVTRVPVPQAAYLTSVAVQGNIAVAVGDSDGVYDAFSGYVGRMVVASFDISDPRNPVLLNTVVTTLNDVAGPSIVAIGDDTFAVGGTTIGATNKPALVLIDATTPGALRYVPYDSLFVSNPQIADGDLFYSLSTTALGIFRLQKIAGPQLTVSLQLPKIGAGLVPGSFNQTPSSVTAGADLRYLRLEPAEPRHDYLQHERRRDEPRRCSPDRPRRTARLHAAVARCGHAGSRPPRGVHRTHSEPPAGCSVGQRRWNAGRLPGRRAQSDRRAADLRAVGGRSAAVVGVRPTGGDGRAGRHGARSIDPDAGLQRVDPRLRCELRLHGTAETPISTPRSPARCSSSAGRTSAATRRRARSLYTVVPAPSAITVGRGDSGTFRLTVTNLGNFADTVFFGAPQGLPSGWFVTYSPSQTQLVRPGLTNATQTVLRVFAPNFAQPGVYPFTLPVSHGFDAPILVPLTVTVSQNGVQGSFIPNIGTPSTAYTLRVTNTGLVDDTFDLSVVGALSQSALLDQHEQISVTLAPGASQDVPVTLTPVSYVVSGNTPLLVEAVSRAATDVRTLISATVVVADTRGVSTAITPSPANVAAVPGGVDLLVRVTNNGNVADAFVATIAGTTGAVTASLSNLDGVQAQTVPQFYIPALGTAILPLKAALTSGQTGTVTVDVRSLSDGAVASSATVTLTGSAVQAPVADAGPGGAIPLNRLTLLDGSGSIDTHAPPLPLTYAWELVVAPATSAVTTASIRFANAARASFVPDVEGFYTFKLTVSTPLASADAQVVFDARVRPPVANAGKPPHARTGGFVFFDGRDSYDPNGLPIAFAWAVQSVPAGSAVTTASLHNAATPKPFFTCDADGAYTLQLIVNNGTFESAPRLVAATCSSANVAPQARAAADGNVGVGAVTALDGTASSDPDAGPQLLTYQWTLTLAPAGSALTTADLHQANTASASFTPDAAGDFIFTLRVADGVAADTDTVTVRAFNGNVPPNAKTGPDQFVTPGALAGLDSFLSSDPDLGPAPLEFLWWLNARPAGSAATLTGATTPFPQFVTDVTGYYVGRVAASDGLASGFANSLVTVAAICDADANGLLEPLDLALTGAAMGSSALPGDPRDHNHNGTIDSGDLAACRAIVTPTTAVTVQANPPGPGFTVDGTPFTAPQTLQVAPNTTLQVSTASPQDLSGSRYTFLNWSDGGAASHSVTVGATPLALTVNFAVSHQLTETVGGPATGR